MAKKKETTITIGAPNFKVAVFKIRGTAPLVMNAFSRRDFEGIKRKQQEGDTAKGKKVKRAPKNFKQCCEDAKHKSRQGWCGIPCAAFRGAMIDACKVVGFVMTRAKLGIFIEQDGFDKQCGSPLVKITKGTPKYAEHIVRLGQGPSSTVDIRARPMWMENWEAKLTVKYDGDMFKPEEIANLLMRAGMQVGVLEGRPGSKNSNGMGWGTFEIVGD